MSEKLGRSEPEVAPEGTTVAPSPRDCRFWILPLTGLLNMTVVLCNYSTFGLLYLELEETFRVSKFWMGWIYSIYCMVGFLTALVYPSLVGRLGYRGVSFLGMGFVVAGYCLSSFTQNFYLLYFCYSSLLGFGIFCTTMNQHTIMQGNVKSHRVLATSIYTTGTSTSGLIWPVVYKVFLDAYSWRGAFLLVAGVVLHSCVIIMVQTSSVLNLVEPVRKRNRKIPEKQSIAELESLTNTKENVKCVASNVTLFQKMKKTVKPNLGYWQASLILATFLFYLGDCFSRFMIGVRLDYVDLSREEIVAVMSARGASGLVKFIPSYLIDRFKIDVTIVTGALSLFLGLSTMVSVTFTTFPAVLTFFTVWGLVQGVFYGLIYPTFVDVFGRERTAKAVGCAEMCMTLSTSLGMPLAGVILDLTENINLNILLFGGLQFCAALIILIIGFCRKRNRDKIKVNK